MFPSICPPSINPYFLLLNKLQSLFFSFFSYMHHIRMPFEISIVVIRSHVLLLMSKPFFLADIPRSSISFSRRRLIFSCVHSALLRPRRSFFRFRRDSSVLYFLKKFRMVVLVAETLCRKYCSKSYWISFKSSYP